MKILKLLFTLLFSLVFLSSCVVEEVVERETIIIEESNYVSDGFYSQNLISDYDLWYVDIHKTTGNSEVPFIQKAFTLTFDNGMLYANNNITDIGKTGNGYGIEIGTYDAYNDILETNHREGFSEFRIVQESNSEIRLDDLNQNVSYYLIGYNINDFDYDKLFFDNIEYFLQEYVTWEQINIDNGHSNPFDNEHYLSFTPDNDNSFSSSKDNFGINIDDIIYDYVGNYEIENYSNNIKRLKLYYKNNDVEVFNLHVVNDGEISLKHLETGTVYNFIGRGFMMDLRSSKKEKVKKHIQKNNRNNNRKRRKVKRN